ncbi:uncharacterized protein FA14DRAFT_191333 [Meira miltonrushii]|uniref:Uncharacterized protein n=1 Tax=Meira miltonrushii TaxID=1280837 RepID=A0A316V9V9_9BASI|nr:uncharacterized protein FA14DRAFT_191333 [Meira miltonrushii]PWN34260.1 hypothetical protein FA14DRAFT_191333 [Meira miltonrushii]
MALSPTQRTFLEPDPASLQDTISVNPLSLYDRRGSKNSYASSSARSHGADSRASDGFYTPTYISSAEFRASRISNRRTSASNQGSQDQHQPNPISPRSQGSFQKDDSSPFMPVRKPKAEVNLFPVDVEDEETEDDAHTPLPLATPVSPSSNPLADWPQSPSDTIPTSQAGSTEGERSYGYLIDSYKRSWEIEATPSKIDPRSDSGVISPYMASFISVEEPKSSNHAFYPTHDLQSSRQDNIEQHKNTQPTFIIPKRRTSSRSGGPETPSIQNLRNVKVENDSLDGALEKIDHIYNSSITPLSSPDSMPQGNSTTFGAQNSASVSDVEFVSDDRKFTATTGYPNSLTSAGDSSNLIAFPGINAPNTFEQENKYLPVQSTNSSNSEVAAAALTTTPRSPLSKASVALQKLGNFRSNVFGGSIQKTDSAPSNFTSSSAKEEYSMTSPSSALALSGLPASFQAPMNENIEVNGIDAKNHYPPSSSRNLNGSSGLGGSQSVDGNIGGGNHAIGLSSIKGRLRTLSGSLRRMNSKSDHSNVDGVGQSFNEGPRERGSGSPLMHAILPSARQSALTLASLAAKKGSSPPISTSHLTTSSDIQSEILRPEDAAMPFIASQRFLRPATSPGIQRGPQMSSSSDTRTSSGWSAPITDETDNSSTLRPTLDTIANTPSSSGSVPTLNSIKRKPVPNLDPTARPRTASPAMIESNSSPQTLSVGKAPRLRNAMSSTALNIPTNAKEHNASVPAVLVPSNFGPQKRSSAASQFGPAYPRRRSSSASQQQNATPPILIRTTRNSEEESVSPLTKTRQLFDDTVDHQSSVDTVTQPIRMPRRGSTSSNRKPVPTILGLAGNNATSDITYDTANRARSSLGAEGHSMPSKSSTTSNTNISFNGYSLTAGGGSGSVQPLSPRSLGNWQGYGHSNVSVESTGSPLNTNIRLRTAPEAQRPSIVSTTGRPSIVSLTGSQTGFGTQSGSSQEHSSHNFPTQNRQQRVSRSSGTGIDSGLQTYLNEEDYQIIEDEPIVAKDLNLASIRHRVAPEFVNTGSRWTNPHRPLSIRSRRMSSDTLRDDAQSMFDGSTSTFNGEQGDMGKKSVLLGSDKEQKKRKGAVEAREKELTVEALSKAEMAYAHIDIWTESRRGKWIVKCPAPDDSYPAEQLPDISDPWMIPIDAKGIVRRKKLKSNIELSSTKTIIICPDCREAAQLNIAHNCSTCHGSERVEMVYTVQCVVRMAQFLPLKLPAALLLGTKQPHIKYIDAADPDHRTDILRDRALEGLQSSAARVIRVHNVQHGSRLLMGRVRITRIGVLTVSIHSAKSKIPRLFDVEDGANGQINEVTHFATTSSGRASVMSNGTSSNRASFSRKGSSAGLSVDHMPLPDDMDSVKSGKTNKSRGASSLFYSLAGKKKNGFGNASSPNLIQSAYQNNADSIPALPDHEDLGGFGRTHKRNNLSVSDPVPILDGQTQLQSTLYTSKANGKRSLKSLFRHH